MIAQRRANIGGLFSYRTAMAGRTGGRGRGGRSDVMDRKRPSESSYDEDGLDDTASSPLKKDRVSDMEEDSELDKDKRSGANKKLDFDVVLAESDVADGGSKEDASGNGAPIPPPPPGYIPPRRTAWPNEYLNMELSGVGRPRDSSRVA